MLYGSPIEVCTFLESWWIASSSIFLAFPYLNYKLIIRNYNKWPLPFWHSAF
jgi:hypothetical protein